MMKIIKQLTLVLFLGSSLTLTGVAQSVVSFQPQKPPERTRERDKGDKDNKDKPDKQDRGSDKPRDGKDKRDGGGDRRKPD